MLFDQRKLGPLEELLGGLAPAAAVMLNIEISLASATYSEESATLARTLLPFVDRVTDYRFLGPEAGFIASRFLSSLALHLKDVQGTVSTGFVAFALHVNPVVLKNMMTSRGSLAALRQVLHERGFQAAAVNAMCLFPAKFLWPDLLAFWRDKSPETVTSCAEILARMDVLTDPGEQMEALVAVLAQRSLLTKCLLAADRIQMPVAKLVRVLDRLALLEAETIQACLQEDSSKWEQLAIQSHNLEELKDEQLSEASVAAFYEERVKDCEHAVALDRMLALSKDIAAEVADYRHSAYQAAIAGVIVSNTASVTVAVAPTGSGKTWVQGLVAKH